MPSTSRCGVDRALPKRRLPVRSSKTAMSVNVPPISAARRRFEPLARDGVRGFILSVGDRGERYSRGCPAGSTSPPQTGRRAIWGGSLQAGLCRLGRLGDRARRASQPHPPAAVKPTAGGRPPPLFHNILKCLYFLSESKILPEHWNQRYQPGVSGVRWWSDLDAPRVLAHGRIRPLAGR